VTPTPKNPGKKLKKPVPPTPPNATERHQARV